MSSTRHLISRARPGLEMLETRVLLSNYYVSPSGSDSNDGTSDAPWRTLQQASSQATAGDTVNVLPGHYAGFNLLHGGTAEQRLSFIAQPGAVIDEPLSFSGNFYGINGSGKEYLSIEGFTFAPQENQPAWYAAIRLGGTPDEWVQGNVVRRNTCRMRVVGKSDSPDKYGIYSSWNDGILVDLNKVSGCYNTGIYTANSARNYTIRRNDVFDVGGNGIHNNGDVSNGEPGIIYNARIERNTIHNVGFGIGGGAINMDGVQDSRIQNNLLYDIHAKGITLYGIDAAEASKRDVVINNTVLLASDGQVPLRINDDASDNIILNNIFYAATPSGAWIDAEESGLDGATINYNVNTGVALVGGTPRDDWQATYGFDANSIVATPDGLFVDSATNSYRLKRGSPAVDAGTIDDAPIADLDGHSRPFGAEVDMGAYEYRPVPLAQPATDLVADAVTSSTVKIRWSDNADNEDGFIVRRKTGADGIWQTIAQVGPNVTEYTNTRLHAGRKYYYLVSPFNEGGTSSYSNRARAWTPRIPTGDGLSATYYDNVGFTGRRVSRVDPVVDFNWGSSAPTKSLQPTTFSVRWTGRIIAPLSKTYTFRLRADDGVRLRVQGRTLIDRWSDGPSDATATFRFEAGRAYDIELSYYQRSGVASIELLWSSPSTPEQVVPSDNLFSAVS